jgi:RNA polymerase sigma-70 factor (ECF subfamily)
MTSAAALEDYRPALTGHCYRMLGSVMDADDAVQETMFRAWKGLDRFAERSSMKTWLYRIATNVCLDHLKDRPRRIQPFDTGPAGHVDDELRVRPRESWVEPIPDALAIPADADPAEQLLLRESIRLAFVAALQHLPPRQRAVLLLTQVLNWSAAEAASALDMTVAAVNSALQRARATLATRDLGSTTAGELTAEQRALLASYVDAFERYDVPALARLLRDDAVMNMPPLELWLQGPDSIAAWFLGHGIGCRGSRLVPTSACGAPAFGQYRDGGAKPWGLIVLDLRGDRLAGMTTFLDVETLFPRFGLPMRLEG